jgi:hypothetical protein
MGKKQALKSHPLDPIAEATAMTIGMDEPLEWSRVTSGGADAKGCDIHHQSWPDRLGRG